MIVTKTRRRLAVAAAVIAEKDRQITRLEKELVNARLALAAVARRAEAEASRAQVAPEPVDAVFVEGIGNPLYDEARAATIGFQAVPA